MIDYKKIFKSRDFRLKILELLTFIPDKLMIKIQYRIKTGRKLNLENPERFTEKLQWYKLNYKNSLMIQCVDKYDIRDYVKNKGMSEILVHCFGIFDSVEDIKWERMPNQFVLKDTLGGGGNSVIIVKDKSKVDIGQVEEECRNWTTMNANVKSGGREWPYYSGKKHRIIIEEYIESDNEQGGLVDYKFFCFNGKCQYIYVIADRELGNGVGLGIYDSNFNKIEVQRADERPLKREVFKPKKFSEMIDIAEKLARDFPEVRVDLYNVEGKIMFGELTFFDGSGYMKFKPDDFDKTFGKCFVLPMKE